jgi:hypothetical protein
MDFRALLAGRGWLHYAAFDVLWLNGRDLRGQKDTTIVHADTSVDVDTVSKTNHIAASAEDSAGPGALQWGPQPPGLPAGARVAVVRGDRPRPAPLPSGLTCPMATRCCRIGIRRASGSRCLRGPSWWAMDGSRMTRAYGHCAPARRRR